MSVRWWRGFPAREKTRFFFSVCITMFCLAAVSALPALADGGTVILHRDTGAFSITLFAPGIPLKVGLTDLSVLVQDRQSGEVLFDPEVDLRATQPGLKSENGRSGEAMVMARLTHAAASNRLLQAANVQFSRAGKWRVELNVRQGAKTAALSTELSVEPNHSRARMVWFYLLLPVGIVLLFAVHQILSRKPS